MINYMKGDTNVAMVPLMNKFPRCDAGPTFGESKGLTWPGFHIYSAVIEFEYQRGGEL